MQVNARDYFTAEEKQAVLEALVVKGKKGHKIVSWRKTGCRFRTPGYIAQQAKTLAYNRFRMPSEMVMLLSHEQQALLLSLAGKLVAMRKETELEKAVSDFLIEEKLS